MLERTRSHEQSGMLGGVNRLAEGQEEVGGSRGNAGLEDVKEGGEEGKTEGEVKETQIKTEEGLMEENRWTQQR